MDTMDPMEANENLITEATTDNLSESVDQIEQQVNLQMNSSSLDVMDEAEDDEESDREEQENPSALPVKRKPEKTKWTSEEVIAS